MAATCRVNVRLRWWVMPLMWAVNNLWPTRQFASWVAGQIERSGVQFEAVR